MSESSVVARIGLHPRKRTPVLFGFALAAVIATGLFPAAAGSPDPSDVPDTNTGDDSREPSAEVIHQVRNDSGRSPAGGRDGRSAVLVDVFIDSQTVPLAAWQMELRGVSPDLQIMNVSGGDASAWQPTPYFDPAGLHGRRIILAAFTTADDPPSGKQRVARLRVSVPDSALPKIATRLHIAAAADGRAIPATVILQAAAR